MAAPELNRTGYAEKGHKSLYPLDAELNSPPELYSLELQSRVAEEAAKNSFKEVVKTIAATTGGNVPKPQAEQFGFHEECEYRRNHQARYAVGVVPPTISSNLSSPIGLDPICRPR
jgi:hypothetical protein